MLPLQLQELLKDLQSKPWIQDLIALGDTYIVGGCVRDAFLKKQIKDVDLVVDGTKLSIIQSALKRYGKVFIVGESFSVIKFRPENHKGEDFDIAVPREDRKIGAGHKGFEIKTEGVDIYGDLKRRDFTVNSIAVNVKTGKILDPFDGLQDLKNKTLEATDINAFIEDPLRMLRGVQFASRFGFNISPQTLKLMKHNAYLLSEIKGERIKEEFDKLLFKGGDTAIALDILIKADLDKALFGKKITNFNKDFTKLDPLSFYYVLGLLGGQDPAKFYKERLKGELNMFKDLTVLDDLFTKLPRIETDEEELKWQIFLISSKSPNVLLAYIIPASVEEIYKEMENGWLPMTPKDIPFTGLDVLIALNLPAKSNEPIVGEIMKQMYKDALNGEYNWQNRGECLAHLREIIEDAG